MTSRLYLTILLTTFFTAFCGVMSAESPGAAPLQPAEKSETGYLRMSADFILKPEKSKIFLPPQTVLEIIEDAKGEYRCKFDTAKSSFICIIPKYQRYIPFIVIESDGKKMRLRGGIEAQTAPIVIERGMELSIISDNVESYSVIWENRGKKYKANISKSLKESVFSKTSLYDDFAKDQAEKGLVPFDGTWVPAELAKKASTAQKELKDSNSAKFDTAKKTAAEGYLVMSDGTILEGKYCGADNDSVFFETSSGMQIIQLDKIALMSTEDAVKSGRTKHIRDALSAARELYRKNDLAGAVRALDSIDSDLKSYQADARFAEGTFKGVSADSAALRSGVDDLLKTSNQAVFEYKVFNKDVLAKHLAAGHVLFKGNIWLNKEQLCKKCGATGAMNCSVCGATGQIVNTCKMCKDGYVECANCAGTGDVECSSCKGSPVFSRSCSACGGIGYFNRRSGLKGIAPGDSWKNQKVKVVTVGDKVIVIPSTPVVNVYSDDPYRYVQDPCKRCNGTGTETISCSTCNGKGRLACPKVQKCQECGGKKTTVSKCEKCSGAKTVPCDACGGNGYTGSPQPE